MLDNTYFFAGKGLRAGERESESGTLCGAQAPPDNGVIKGVAYWRTYLDFNQHGER